MTIEKLFDFGHLHKPSLYADEDTGKFVGKNLDEMGDVHKIGRKNVEEIMGSRSLTREGKSEALKNEASEINALLQPFDRTAASYDSRVREIEESLTPKLRDYGDVVGHMMLQEVRNYLRSFDPLERDAYIRNAMIDDNDPVLEAILQCPNPGEFGDKALMGKIRSKLISIRNPEDAARIGQMRLAQRELVSALNSVRADLTRRGLNLGADAVSQADAA